MCTELELHVLQAFRDDGEPMDLAYVPEDVHILQEFLDGYKTEGAYINEHSTEEERKMMSDFIILVEADIAGGADYTSGVFDTVIKAIRHFGL